LECNVDEQINGSANTKIDGSGLESGSQWEEEWGTGAVGECQTLFGWHLDVQFVHNIFWEYLNN
jgi:hypothetical protein